MRKSTTFFIVAVLLWQIAVGVIYGLFIRYNQSSFTNMATSSAYQYYFAGDSTNFSMYTINNMGLPFPQIVLAVAIILLLVGLALVSAYVQRSAFTNMAFTLLIFALTIQNFFIFRNFWDRVSANNPNASKDFTTRYYQKLNYVNFGNSLSSSYAYTSSSFLDAIGAALGLYAGFSSIMGCIGLGQVFILTFIGTFFYQVNSEVLWRLYIPDNGFPSRAFAFGGALGIISSLLSGNRSLKENNPNYMSSYYLRTLSFLGVILVWCTYPILVTLNVYNSSESQIIAMSGQVNMWLALAGSVLGCYTASSYVYRKFCVHDMVYAAFTGAIAYSSSTEFNYNPGAALAIGSIVGLVSTLCQTKLKKIINNSGVVDSNGALFQFLLPSLFAAIFSAILAGFGQSSATATVVRSNLAGAILSFDTNRHPSRSDTSQGGYQILGWLISVGFGIGTGLIVGLFYWLLAERQRPEEFFNDMTLYSQPKDSYATEQVRQRSEVK